MSITIILSFPGDSVVKSSPASAGDVGGVGSIPGLGRSPGEGNSKPLQYSCLDNPMDREAWGGYSHRVPKNQTRLSMHAHTIILEYFHYPEKKHPHSLSINPQVLPCFAPHAIAPSPWKLLICCLQRLASWGHFIEMGSYNMWLFVSDFSHLACFQGSSTLQYFVSFY